MVLKLARLSKDAGSATQDNSHVGPVRAVILSPDAKILASFSDDKVIKLWDAATGKHRNDLIGHGGVVKSVSFSQDRNMLASCSSDKSIRLWKTDTGKFVTSLVGHTRWINSAAFSPDGRRVVSASNDKSVRLWDITTGKQIGMHSAHGDWVTAVAFSPSGRTIASASRDKTVKLWDLEAQPEKEPNTLVPDMSEFVQALKFSNDGQSIKVGGSWFGVDSNHIAGVPITQPAFKTIVKGDWIVREGEQVLWLPPDYRATCSASHGKLLVLGHSTGRITFITFRSA